MIGNGNPLFWATASMIVFDGVVRRKLCGDISKCVFATDCCVSAVCVSMNGQIQVI